MSSYLGHLSNLFRQLCFSAILITIQRGEGYLTTKPQDALRALGQSVTFTCNSTWTDPIRWWFIRDDGADRIIDELGTNEDVHLTLSNVTVVGEIGEGSPDGYRSSLTINEVTSLHAGTFRCQDGTGSRGSARLTVTSTSKTVCLTVSPRDQVVVAGDSVVFTASGPSTSLRYYFESSDKLSKRVELYDGEEFDDCNVDERFSVVGVGDKGHADLVIRSVQPQDAGRYIVKDVWEIAYEVAANLIVFDDLPVCTLIWLHTEDNGILLQCHAKYTGQLIPRVLFLRDDVTAKALQKTESGGIIRFEHWFKFSDLTRGDIAADSKTFEIGFELSRCGEPAGSWSWKHAILNDVEILTYATLKHKMTWIANGALCASVVVNVVFIVLCIRRNRHNCHSQNSKDREAACGGYDRVRTTSASSTSSSSTSSSSTSKSSVSLVSEHHEV